MPTRNVVLTESQNALIETLVQSGRYQNASEVLREGLRMVERREAEDAAKLEALRAAAQVGVAALGARRFQGIQRRIWPHRPSRYNGRDVVSGAGSN